MPTVELPGRRAQAPSSADLFARLGAALDRTRVPPTLRPTARLAAQQLADLRDGLEDPDAQCLRHLGGWLSDLQRVLGHHRPAVYGASPDRVRFSVLLESVLDELGEPDRSRIDLVLRGEWSVFGDRAELRSLAQLLVAAQLRLGGESSLLAAGDESTARLVIRAEPERTPSRLLARAWALDVGLATTIASWQRGHLTYRLRPGERLLRFTLPGMPTARQWRAP